MEVKLLGDSEILEVLMISPDLYGVSCTLQVVEPLLQSLDDHKHFWVVYLIVAFDLTEALGQELVLVKSGLEPEQT